MTTCPKKRTPHNQEGGFSLIELLVTIGIVIIVTTLVLARYSAFDGAVLLKNQAYDVALSLRQMQSYGMGSDLSGSGFRAPYGVHFTRGSDEYILFQDIHPDPNSPDGEYTPNDDVLLGTLQLRNGFLISGLSGGLSAGELSVTFERPNFDAIVDGSNTNATITIQDDDSGVTRQVVIGAGGYISVQ